MSVEPVDFSTWTDEQLRAFVRAHRKAPTVTLSDLQIRTKDKRLVTFTPKPIQAEYLDTLSSTYPGFDWRSGAYSLHGVREDILKARQIGWSTLWLALYFCDTINHPMTQTIILAHDTESTERLFQIVKRYYDHLPEPKKRPTKYSTRRELHFADIDSVLFVGTAGAQNVGRGGTINNVLASERAFWTDGAEVEAALLEAVPVEGNVVRETTANGLNDYYREYQQAKAGESVFRPRFFGWHRDQENSLTEEQYAALVPAGVTLDTEGEEEHRRVYSLNPGQVRWRRWKKLQLKGKFAQEHPIDDGEAFLASGNPVFNRRFLYALLTDCNAPQWGPERIETPDDSAWNATIRTYVDPEEDHSYLIVADPSEGIDEYGDHDYSVVHVYDRASWEQVCHYRGRPDPHNLGLDLAVLGHIYNDAEIAVLRNNHGHSVLNTLINQCHYPLIYHHAAFDERGKAAGKRPGFPETNRSKPEAVDDLESIIEEMAGGEQGFVWRDPNTIEELIHYVKKEGHKVGAEAGSHDDEVSCCYVAANLMPAYTTRLHDWSKVEQEPWQPRYREEYSTRRGRG